MPGSERPKAVHGTGGDPKSDNARKAVAVRYGTEADLIQFYGKRPDFSARTVVADLDGKIIAVGGVYRSGTQMYGFSEMKEEMRGRKKAMLRMVRLGLPLLMRHAQILAFANPAEPTANGFLTSLGFEHQGPSEHGEVYIWIRSRQQQDPSAQS